MADSALIQAELCQGLNLAALLELVPPARRVPLQVEIRIEAQDPTLLTSSTTLAPAYSRTSLHSIAYVANS